MRHLVFYHQPTHCVSGLDYLYFLFAHPLYYAIQNLNASYSFPHSHELLICSSHPEHYTSHQALLASQILFLHNANHHLLSYLHNYFPLRIASSFLCLSHDHHPLGLHSFIASQGNHQPLSHPFRIP